MLTAWWQTVIPALPLRGAGADAPVVVRDHALRAYARQRSMRQHVHIPVRPRSGSNTPAERSGGLTSISSGEPALQNVLAPAGTLMVIKQPSGLAPPM